MRFQTKQVGVTLSLLAGCSLACLVLPKTQAQVSGRPVFSHPTQITHPYLPLNSLQQAVFEGKEGGKSVRVLLTRKPTKKTFVIDGKTIAPLAIKDREFEDGKLKEVTLDYYAQDDAGTVYYLGEEVDNYKNGKVIGHEGAWEYGKGKAALGVMLPAHLQVGAKFQLENVPGVTREDDEVVSTSESLPLGRKPCHTSRTLHTSPIPTGS